MTGHVFKKNNLNFLNLLSLICLSIGILSFNSTWFFFYAPEMENAVVQ